MSFTSSPCFHLPFHYIVSLVAVDEKSFFSFFPAAYIANNERRREKRYMSRRMARHLLSVHCVQSFHQGNITPHLASKLAACLIVFLFFVLHNGEDLRRDAELAKKHFFPHNGFQFPT